MVQDITNKLDAGDIYSFAESKVVNYSYRKTSLNFYRSSRYLLRKAILNVRKGSKIKKKPKGTNYQLPSNTLVFIFTIKLFTRLLKKIIYGLFFEKNWRIGYGNVSVDPEKDNILSIKNFNILSVEGRFSFYADPFFSKISLFYSLRHLTKKPVWEKSLN